MIEKVITFATVIVTTIATSIFAVTATFDYFLYSALRPKATVQKKSVPTKNPSSNQGAPGLTVEDGEWGVAKKIGDHTYSILVGQDERMGTATEILEALNHYRQTNGTGTLTMDNGLLSYSQGRADYFKQIRSTDGHSGFNNFLDNEDGFNRLGFNRLGENSYFGGPLLGVHLIEWVFSKSAEHNANQLDPGWTHAGIGVTDNSVNIIFGGKKM